MDCGLSFAGVQDVFAKKQRDSNNEHGAQHAAEGDPPGRVGIRVLCEPHTDGRTKVLHEGKGDKLQHHDPSQARQRVPLDELQV